MPPIALSVVRRNLHPLRPIVYLLWDLDIFPPDVSPPTFSKGERTAGVTEKGNTKLFSTSDIFKLSNAKMYL